MGIALHNYHDVHRTFPPGYRFLANSHTDTIGGVNVSILPHLEQANIFNKMELEQPWFKFRPDIASNDQRFRLHRLADFQSRRQQVPCFFSRFRLRRSE